MKKEVKAVPDTNEKGGRNGEKNWKRSKYRRRNKLGYHENSR